MGGGEEVRVEKALRLGKASLVQLKGKFVPFLFSRSREEGGEKGFTREGEEQKKEIQNDGRFHLKSRNRRCSEDGETYLAGGRVP